MTCNPTAFPKAVLAEASRLSPQRRTSSDGICPGPDETQGDHFPDARGIPHAVDISQSKPGAPFWQPGMGEFDAHQYGDTIALRIMAGSERRVKYLVSHNYVTGSAKIFDPSIGKFFWRDQPGDTHASHLHVSFLATPAVEESTAPFFASGDAPHPAPSPSLGGSNMIVVVHPHIVGAYWCITFDGHIYAYGGAKAFGGTGTPTDPKFNGAITSAAATITGNGLLIATAAKSLYVFGDAVKHGDPHGDPRT